MKASQSQEIIKRLRYIFPNGDRFFDENKNRLMEYSKDICEMNYEPCLKAIDNLKRRLSFVPSLAELWQEYELIKPKDNAVIENKEHCHVCDNKGFMLHIKRVANGDKDIEYQHLLYCDRCEKGQEYAYTGKNYYVEPISKCYDTQTLEAKGVFRVEVNEVALRKVKHLMKEVSK